MSNLLLYGNEYKSLPLREKIHSSRFFFNVSSHFNEMAQSKFNLNCFNRTDVNTDASRGNVNHKYGLDEKSKKKCHCNSRRHIIIHTILSWFTSHKGEGDDRKK